MERNLTKIKKDRKRIEAAVVALDDWLYHFAPEWCDEEDVAKSIERVWENGGTIGYITKIREDLAKVLSSPYLKLK